MGIAVLYETKTIPLAINFPVVWCQTGVDMAGGCLSGSVMAREAAEAAEMCVRQVALNAELMRRVGARLRALDAPFAATLARGSSDQAAAFAKVLFETRATTPTLSHAPSIGALYNATSPRFHGVPLLAISQSGRSPDLLRAAADAQRQGAVLIAIVNDAASPLAAQADIVIPIHAGEETSVAATKSFIATLVALTHLTAEWTGDAAQTTPTPIITSRVE